MNEMYLRNDPNVTKRVANSSVAILGLGGLGSNVAVILARVGVGSLTLIDFDRVELSNLNRQHYTHYHLGEFKTVALKNELSKINPSITLKTHNVKLSYENLSTFLSSESIICEAFDSAESKAMVAHFAAKNLDKKFVFGNGMSGYKSSNLMQRKKFGENIYICGDFKSGDYLMAPRVLMCASLQANTILELIMGEI